MNKQHGLTARISKVMGSEPIPVLEDIIQLINGRVRLNIELKGKNTSKGVFNIMQTAVESGRWKMNQLYVSSFDWEELREFRKADESVWNRCP